MSYTPNSKQVHKLCGFFFDMKESNIRKQGLRLCSEESTGVTSSQMAIQGLKKLKNSVADPYPPHSRRGGRRRRTVRRRVNRRRTARR